MITRLDLPTSTYRRGSLLIGVLLASALSPATGLGQAREPEMRLYGFVSDASHAEALWLNPGGLGLTPVTNAVAHVTWDRSQGSDWRTAQYLVGLQAGPLAGGYRHDEFGAGGFSQGDAYSLAVGVASEGATGFGVSRTWHSVGPTEGSWEIGILSRTSSGLSAGLVWRDIGSPSLRDTLRDSRLVAGLTARPGTAGLAVSLEGDYRTGPGDFRRFRLGARFHVLDRMSGLGLASWNGDGDFIGLSLGLRLSLGRSATGTGVAALDSDLDARAASVGVLLLDSRTADGHRRGRRR